MGQRRALVEPGPAQDVGQHGRIDHEREQHKAGRPQHHLRLDDLRRCWHGDQGGFRVSGVLALTLRPDPKPCGYEDRQALDRCKCMHTCTHINHESMVVRNIDTCGETTRAIGKRNTLYQSFDICMSCNKCISHSGQGAELGSTHRSLGVRWVKIVVGHHSLHIIGI